MSKRLLLLPFILACALQDFSAKDQNLRQRLVVPVPGHAARRGAGLCTEALEPAIGVPASGQGARWQSPCPQCPRAVSVQGRAVSAPCLSFLI